MPGAPTAVEEFAAAGDTQHLLADLSQFAELGQADESLLNGKDQSFSALHHLPQYE